MYIKEESDKVGDVLLCSIEYELLTSNAVGEDSYVLFARSKYVENLNRIINTIGFFDCI